MKIIIDVRDDIDPLLASRAVHEVLLTGLISNANNGIKKHCHCTVFSRGDMRGIAVENNLPRNPVKDKLCISGECLCGAFARPEERAEIREMFPEVNAEIERIEAKCKAAGVPCVWGKAPASNWKHASEQTSMFMPLCSDCNAENI